MGCWQQSSSPPKLNYLDSVSPAPEAEKKAGLLSRGTRLGSSFDCLALSSPEGKGPHLALFRHQEEDLSALPSFQQWMEGPGGCSRPRCEEPLVCRAGCDPLEWRWERGEPLRGERAPCSLPGQSRSPPGSQESAPMDTRL